MKNFKKIALSSVLFIVAASFYGQTPIYQPYNHFANSELKFSSSITHNRFLGRGSAIKVFKNGVEISETEKNRMFDGNFDSNYQMNNQQTTLLLNFTDNNLTGSSGYTYASGYFRISFYSGAESIIENIRWKNKDGVWTSLVVENNHNYYGNTSENTMSYSARISGNYIVALEISFLPNSTNFRGAIWLTQIEYIGTRIGTKEGPLLTTLGGKIYNDLEGFDKTAMRWKLDKDGLEVTSDLDINLSNLKNSGILVGSETDGIGIDKNEIVAKGNDLFIGTVSNHNVKIASNGKTALKIQGGNGHTGIGTETPKGSFHVKSFGPNLLPDFKKYVNTDQNEKGLIMEGYILDGNNSFSRVVDFVALSDGVQLNNRKSIMRFLTQKSSDNQVSTNMVINGGKVGIGTETPAVGLHLKSNRKQANSIDDGIGLLKTLSGDYSIQLTSNNGTPHLDFANSSNEDYDVRLGVYYDNKLAILGGNVGIGTNNPSAGLHMKSNINQANSVDDGIGLLKTLSGDYSIQLTSNNGAPHLDFANSSNEDYDVRLGVYYDNKLAILGGNVGIGVRNPGDWKLAVDGKIKSKEVKVTVDGWSDFVFKKDYNLPTLKEVEQHIKEKGHLKDIPNAAEVENNGIFLGEINAKLLQKIEELTLYTIEQEKKLQRQQKKNLDLEKKIFYQHKEITELKKMFLKLSEKLSDKK